MKGRDEGPSIIAIVTFTSRRLHKHSPPMSTASDDYDLDGFGRYELGSDCSPPGMKLPPNPDYKFDREDEPLSPRERAPSLPRLKLEPSSVEFLERLPNGLHEGAPSGVFRVKITNMGERVLKVVRRVQLKPLLSMEVVN